ncbi:hypothetical protein C8J57DRAFT_1638898 [Mycena rebaudengoi]|nr:hypothetical protein C8J57DRAFT_1638898 [Mycena rebaudengoi]
MATTPAPPAQDPCGAPPCAATLLPPRPNPDLPFFSQIGDYSTSTVYRLPSEATIRMSTGLCGSELYIAPERFWANASTHASFQGLPWRAAYAVYAAAAAQTPPPSLAPTRPPPPPHPHPPASSSAHASSNASASNNSNRCSRRRSATCRRARAEDAAQDARAGPEGKELALLGWRGACVLAGGVFASGSLFWLPVPDASLVRFLIRGLGGM